MSSKYESKSPIHPNKAKKDQLEMNKIERSSSGTSTSTSTNPAQAAGAGEDINNRATKQDDSNSVSSVSGPASGSANGGGDTPKTGTGDYDDEFDELEELRRSVTEKCILWTGKEDEHILWPKNNGATEKKK